MSKSLNSLCSARISFYILFTLPIFPAHIIYIPHLDSIFSRSANSLPKFLLGIVRRSYSRLLLLNCQYTLNILNIFSYTLFRLWTLISDLDFFLLLHNNFISFDALPSLAFDLINRKEKYLQFSPNYRTYFWTYALVVRLHRPCDVGHGLWTMDAGSSVGEEKCV